MSYEREVDVSLTKQAEVSVDQTTITTTATRTVRTEVTTPAPAESGLRRREVKSSGSGTSSSSTTNSRFLPCEYYGRQPGAGVLTDEDEELERRQARDLVRAIENRRVEQPTSLTSHRDQKSFAASSSGREEESFDRFGTANEEEEEEQEVDEEDEEEEEEEEEEEQEEEEEEVDHRQGRKRLDAMKKKSEQYVKRVAKEVDDARHKALKVKHRATAAAKRAASWYPSPTTAFLLRLLIGSLLGALLCLATYEYFFSWGPSRPVYFADGTFHHLPPGSKAGSWGIPYVGETIDYYRDPFKFTLRHAEKYGPVSYSNVLGDHTVMLSGSKALGQVFYNASLVQRRDALPKSIARLLGRDILPALDNSRHAEVRAIIMQAINTRGVIQVHLSNLDRVMNHHMAQWTMESVPFDLLRDIKDMTASMASTLFFTNDESAFLAPLLDEVLAALSVYPSPLTGSTYSRGVLAKDQLIGWYERAITDHAREIEARSNKYNGDVLDLMLKLTHKIPDITPRHLAHELHYLVLSTYELYNPISAVFVAMEQYPDWVPLLREEVDAMHLDPEYPALPFDKLHRIDLLSLFINETRRFYPAAVAEWGKAKMTFFYDGYVIPEGFKLMASVAATHLDEAEHKNARAFDPTRFADEIDNSYNFVPHGGGARDSASSHRCLGEDLSFYTVKLFLMNLFSRHDWRLATGQNVNFDTAHYLPEPHALQASSFINTTSTVSFSQFAPTVPFDPHLTSDHIAVAVA